MDTELVAAFDLVVLDAVVEGLRVEVANVPEPVPLAAFLGVVVIEHVVVSEQPPVFETLLGVLDGRALEERRVGIVNRRVEAKDLALAHELGGLDYAVLRQEGDTSYLVVVAKRAPVRIGRRARLDRQLRETGNFIEVNFSHRCIFLWGISLRAGVMRR